MSPTDVFGYADKLTLVGVLFALVVCFMKGWIVPGPTHDRVVKERDQYLDAATRGMELAKRTISAAMEKKDA